MSAAAVRVLREQAEALKAEVARSDLDVVDTLARLSNQRATLRTEVTSLAQRTRDAARFFSASNMKLLLHAAKVSDVSVDADANFRFRSNDSWRRLGSNGLHEV